MNAVIFPPIGIGHAVIADDWIGHAQDLAGVGGIGDCFGIAYHAGAKNHFARNRPVVPKRRTLKARAVFQDERAAYERWQQKWRFVLNGLTGVGCFIKYLIMHISPSYSSCFVLSMSASIQWCFLLNYALPMIKASSAIRVYRPFLICERR